MFGQSDHIALNLLEDGSTPRRQFRLKRQWKQLSKCQRSVIYLVGLIFTLTYLYFISVDSKGAIITVEGAPGVTEKSVTLGNIRNDPRDVVEIGVEVNNDNQVLEDPEGAQVNNKVDSEQVAEPPKNLINFPDPSTPRQKAVVQAFRHAWKGYKEFAWGHDQLKPISKSYHDWFGLGLTIVDSLDTMYMMNLKEEYNDARNWVDKHLHFDVNRDVNLFEVTIRVLGGLLSIYHFTKDDMYLKKATDLADRLLPCFESDSGIPFSDINLFTRKAHAPRWSPDSSTSEVTTIQLEFRYLSWLTDNSKYENVVSKVSQLVHRLEKTDGLVPIFINANNGQFRAYATITLGARGDSYYEYLLKQWIQSEKTLEYLKNDYLSSVNGIEKHLAKRTVPNGLLFLGELVGGTKDFKPKMDHLTCFMPGTLALGAHNGLPNSHMKLAEELLATCYQTYAKQPTFLAPEITYFNFQGENSNDMYIKSNDAHNLLRPEFLESLWYMYQLTGNTTYQDWGWQIFQIRTLSAQASSPTEIGSSDTGAPVETGESKKNLSKAMKAYLERAREHDEFMKSQRHEFEIGKRHLANMMGENPETFTQEDIDTAIEYLFPSGLYQKHARPIMKPPEEVFPQRKAAEFDETGRPYHFLFYTGRSNFYQVLYDVVEHINEMYKFEDSMTRKNLQPDPMLTLNLSGTEWIEKSALEFRVMETVSDREYNSFVTAMVRLSNMPFSYKVKDFIMEYRVSLMNQSQTYDAIKPQIREDGREFVTVYECRRKRAIGNVTVISPGTGKITINGQGISYFEGVQEREQILFPLIFSNMQNKVDIEAEMQNGGPSGQAGAIRYGISWALRSFIDQETMESMRLAGLLTYDIRVRERLKPGQSGARRKFTWKKR